MTVEGTGNHISYPLLSTHDDLRPTFARRPHRMPFIDSAELAGILGEPHTTVYRALANLLADGIAGRVSHGTAHLPSSHKYYLTAQGT